MENDISTQQLIEAIVKLLKQSQGGYGQLSNQEAQILQSQNGKPNVVANNSNTGFGQLSDNEAQALKSQIPISGATPVSTGLASAIASNTTFPTFSYNQKYMNKGGLKGYQREPTVDELGGTSGWDWNKDIQAQREVNAARERQAVSDADLAAFQLSQRRRR